MNASTPVGAHIVGRVPLDGPEEVFRTLGEHVGSLLCSMPDGETETNWIGSQVGLLSACAEVEQIAPLSVMLEEERKRLAPFALRAGVDPDRVELGGLGYAPIAGKSFGVLAGLKERGAVGRHVRLQVNLPSPVTVTYAFLVAQSRAAFESIYERAMVREIEAVLREVPGDQLTIGFDLPIETVALEGVYEMWFDQPVQSAVVERLGRLASVIPAEVPLGFHLCLGSRNNRHEFVPADAGRQVSFMNRLLSELPRSVQWLHVPVPREAADVESYLAPFAELRLPEHARLYLGVVAIEDGLQATQRRIDAARTVLPRFGVATVCGLAGDYYPPDAIVELLDLHTKVTEPIAA